MPRRFKERASKTEPLFEETSIPENLEEMVDASLVQRLIARGDTAGQQKAVMEHTKKSVGFVPPSLSDEPAEMQSRLAPDRSKPSAGSPWREQPLSTLPFSVAIPGQRQNDVDAPARATENIPYQPLLQRKPVYAKNKAVNISKEISTPPERGAVHSPPQLVKRAQLLQRAAVGDIEAESQAREVLAKDSEPEPLELLDGSDLMQLSREILPILKRLLGDEMERHSQPDLSW